MRLPWARKTDLGDHIKEDNDTHTEQTRVLGDLVRGQAALTTTVNEINANLAGFADVKKAMTDVLDARKFWTSFRKRFAASTIFVMTVAGGIGAMWPIVVPMIVSMITGHSDPVVPKPEVKTQAFPGSTQPTPSVTMPPPPTIMR